MESESSFRACYPISPARGTLRFSGLLIMPRLTGAAGEAFPRIHGCRMEEGIPNGVVKNELTAVVREG